ncbi:response regulator [Planctomicrobium sp. SH664]|uniref:ATP-binding protein n=1 Tax=Planctomicrobium sp. SH664 TaxID=3448125 RepID=UPI003F5B0820
MVNILVVDDSSMDRKIAGGLLQKVSGWEVDYAADGREAWEQLQQAALDPPDVIVTDLQMPEMNGLELVREVHQKFPLVPVILMTGQGSETIAVEALRLGAASYVPKTKLADLLVNTVRQVLSLAGERRTQKTLLKRLESMTCRFILDNDPAVLTSLVAYLQGVLRDMEVLTESDRLRSGVALEEALLNAAYHGNLEVSSELREIDHAKFYELAKERAQLAPYMFRRIDVGIAINEDGVTYIVRDEGPGFDPSKLPDPTDPANLERPCGRGVLLMRTFMDDVSYNATGNEVTMIKRSARGATIL